MSCDTFRFPDAPAGLSVVAASCMQFNRQLSSQMADSETGHTHKTPSPRPSPPKPFTLSPPGSSELAVRRHDGRKAWLLCTFTPLPSVLQFILQQVIWPIKNITQHSLFCYSKHSNFHHNYLLGRETQSLFLLQLVSVSTRLLLLFISRCLLKIKTSFVFVCVVCDLPQTIAATNTTCWQSMTLCVTHLHVHDPTT